jgi:hypothetical protein
VLIQNSSTFIAQQGFPLGDLNTLRIDYFL